MDGNGGIRGILLSIVLLLQLPFHSVAFPLCTNSRAPVISKTPLKFCSYNGSTCCDSAKDSQLKKQLQAYNVSSTACASLLKSILCAQCDQYSADIFKIEFGVRNVPVLCNSTTLEVNSTQSNTARNDFCSKVWDTCQNASILNSPFAPSLQGSTGGGAKINSSSKLTDLWQSKADFCGSFGGSSSEEGSLCFDGKPVFFNENSTTTETEAPPNGLCLEKLGNDSFLNMVAHPDGSNRVFLANQKGEIWLAAVPENGSGEALVFEESPFLDLTDQVHFDTEFGLLGIAFHPDFTRNGRFFVSYNCDKVTSPRCSGRCACNSDAKCDPSKLASDSGADPCQYHSVIAEYSSNGTASKSSLKAVVNPTEVQRIFTMGLPFTGHHAGQILFGPADGYLYFMMGDGGKIGDPYNFSQNKKSLLGKIMRFDIDNAPSANESDHGLWGNYSIPKDNPYVDDKDSEPEIFAMGFRNPWRCSFDSKRPSYFLCADVGQEIYEEVDIITKGGNYGWRVYEGNSHYNPPESPGGNTSSNSINPIFPVMGYSHSDANEGDKEGSASIAGGYFYRSMTDPCMYGRYLYADLYAGAMWAAEEIPTGSGKFNTTKIPFSCGSNSPIPCTYEVGSSVPDLGYIFSYGEDNKKDIYLLASSGVYRIVRPSRCNYACSKDNGTTSNSTPKPSDPSSSSRLMGTWLYKIMSLLYSSFLILLCFNL
ncbi:HIPL1 protein-like [Papaver somniferum]|uniref:HIPL1 protein-like n=1 Tax=Papaver somniferum TaxID=3469 RepID=UPI000E70238E|nr:HIPL1 protein-like [Papaver somniferum]